MFTLENNKLLMEIDPKGAEIKRIFNKETETELLWSGDASFWGRVSPVLFPIVGRVANDCYWVDEKEFSLSQHGFARDEIFSLERLTDDTIWLELNESDESLKRYPFKFRLRIGYMLEENTVTVRWVVENKNDDEMFFSIGAHPAFNIALQKGDQLADYFLHLETLENMETYIFDASNGLVKDEKEMIMPGLKLLPLSKDLFEEYPTVIFEGETGISLKSYHHEHGMKIKFEGFPYVGIWSPINQEGEGAPFVCIEPWFGMADTDPKGGQLRDKKGIQKLEASGVFNAAYSMEFE